MTNICQSPSSFLLNKRQSVQVITCLLITGIVVIHAVTSPSSRLVARTNRAQSSGAGNPVDFFLERRCSKSSSSISENDSFLRVMKLPIQSENNQPVSSLTIRGGFTPSSNNAFHVLQQLKSFRLSLSESINLEQQSYSHAHNADEYLKYGIQENIMRIELMESVDPVIIKIQQQIRQRLTTLRSFKASPLFSRERHVLKTPYLVSALSEVLLFSGSHLETVWFNIKPSVSRWFSNKIQSKYAFMRERIQLEIEMV